MTSIFTSMDKRRTAIGVTTLLILLLLLGACATGPSPSPPDGTAIGVQPSADTAMADTTATESTPTASEQTPLPTDPAVTVGQLENGLSYYIRSNSEPPNRASLRLVVNAGSILEDEDQLGLAHFVEHMAFNGTANYSGNEIIAFLERLGTEFGPDVNAYTSFDETVYELTVPTDDPELFREAFSVLHEWAALMSISTDAVDGERGVIIEEWRYRRNATSRMRDIQYPVLFADSRYAERMPIGDIDLIANFPPEAARRFYHDWYRPDLMAIVAVGDFESTDVEELIGDLFGDFTGPGQPRERVTYTVPSHDDTRFVVASDPETPYTDVSVYVKRDSEELESLEDYRSLLAGGLFSAMLNARLEEISRQSDAPFLAAGVSSGRLVRPTSAAALQAIVDGNDVGPALEALVVEMRRVLEYGFTETELERARQNRMRFIEQIYRERDNTDSDIFAEEYIRAFLEGEAFPGIAYERDLHEQLLPEISLEEVNELARTYLDDTNRVVMVSSIDSPDLPRVTEDDLRSAFARAMEVDLDAYTDVVVDSQLLQSIPAPGSIVGREDLDDLGAYVWQLSNGARVILLPTHYKEDEILFAAWSDGGSSVASDAQYRSAQYSTAFVEQMGYGELSPPDLERVLAGTTANVSPDIGSLFEALSGSASAEDVELLMQLIHLKMTAPRRDEDAFNALKHQFLALVANQEAQPQYQFQRLLQSRYSNGHLRTMPIDTEGVESIDIDDVLSVYEDRFGDASDFTFLFVGNLDPGILAPLVESYLASLPSTRRHDGWVDRHITRPDGIVVDSVDAGLDPVSRVAVVFHGPYEFSQDNNYQIRALERLLEIRMQEVIREDESGTYGVGVQAQFVREPDPRYSILITFSADPDRVDQLTASLFDVVDEIRTTVPSQDYVQRITETQRANFEEGLTSNEFWLGQVEYALQNDRPLSAIMRYLDLVDALDGEALREAARTYLDTDRYVQVTLYPAGDGR